MASGGRDEFYAARGLLGLMLRRAYRDGRDPFRMAQQPLPHAARAVRERDAEGAVPMGTAHEERVATARVGG
eukprot:3669650-Prymnesium_polylepis.1